MATARAASPLKDRRFTRPTVRPRRVPVEANGVTGFASYKPSPEGGLKPWSIQILELSVNRIVGHHSFLDTSLVAAFDLPDHL